MAGAATACEVSRQQSVAQQQQAGDARMHACEVLHIQQALHSLSRITQQTFVKYGESLC